MLDKAAILKKMEELVSSARKTLDKNDGSTIETITATVKAGIENLKSAVSDSEKAHKAYAEMKKYMDVLEKEVKKKDRELSRSLLDKAAKKLKELSVEKESLKNTVKKKGSSVSRTVKAKSRDLSQKIGEKAENLAKRAAGVKSSKPGEKPAKEKKDPGKAAADKVEKLPGKAFSKNTAKK